MTDLNRRARMLETYGSSAAGHFVPIDTIGTPHPYCIGPRHVAHASDHFSGRLGSEAIEDAEQRGKARCMTRGCTLKYHEHETALLIECAAPLHEACGCGDGHVSEELVTFLKGIADLATQNRIAGFAFLQRKG